MNELFDSVIGGKFKSRPFLLSGSAFSLVPGGTAALSGGQWTFSALSALVCPIVLPVNAVIASIVWGFNRGGAGNVVLKLRKRNIITGAAAADVISSTISAGTGYTTETDLPAYVVEANTGLWLEATFDNAAHVFGGAVLTAGVP